MDTNISVQFLGGVAGNNLTGSCTLLIIKRRKRTTRILVDIGMIQCGFKEFFADNYDILNHLKPENIDAVILTHPHIDHVGRLPLLVKTGFTKSRILCTEATADLLRVMLEDSAKIQSIESTRLKERSRKEKRSRSGNSGLGRERLTLGNYDRVRRKGKQAAHRPDEPLYTLTEVEAAGRLVKNGGCPYQTWIKIDKGIDLKLYPSGHVLGGAICVIRIETKNNLIHLGFSGDLGPRNGIILPPPALVEEALDYWVSESTYGGKTHPPREEEISRLLDLVRRAIDKKQKIIIPSFALERTQEIVYLLSYYMQDKTIPLIPIYLDSPMAAKITSVFAKNWHQQMFLGQEALRFNPFDTQENIFFKTIGDKASSLALLKEPAPHIIIAGSGMCDAGRIRDHLRTGLSQKNTIICLVGYMATNSLGRKLKDRLPIVKMNGDEIVVKAEIVDFDSFSAHADSPFLVDYTKTIAARGKLKKIFLNHGEEMSSASLKMELINALADGNGYWLKNIQIPKLGEELILS
ncbi:MAG: MBL fold metallo-hydrolase [Patescibacteria group bacterium]